MDENDWTSGRRGPFRLGASHALGPGLGQLYEAWHTQTAAPVLLLRPGDEVEWWPEGVWRVQLSFVPEWSAVALTLDEAPPLADASELANLLVLSTAAVTRLEDDPQVRAHLATRPPERATPSASPEDGRGPSWRGMSLMGIALLAMGIGWLGGVSDAAVPRRAFPCVPPEEAFQTGATFLEGLSFLGAAPISYPMRSKPFDNQAVPPCLTKRDEVEINGGCWIALDRRPPCLDDSQAEYQGKCYLPMAKDRGKRPARSVQP